MQIFTPNQIADQAGNKYLGVLVAARFARYVNDFPRDRSLEEKKLTTRALEELVSGRLQYRLVRRRRQET
jgi:DNA-directed RNA polymerase subunit K/omega